MFHNNKECIIKNGNKGIVFHPILMSTASVHGKLHCLKLEQRTPYLSLNGIGYTDHQIHWALAETKF